MACAIVLALLLASCGGETPVTGAGGGAKEHRMEVRTESVEMGDVEGVERFVLTNDNGMSVTVINYGAIVTSIVVPDRDGAFGRATLGFEDYEGYSKNPPYFGAICGRFSNRIAKGKFTVDATEYTLATNNGPNHLHGGDKGFDKSVWKGLAFGAEDAVGVELTHRSPDGDEGYPGNLDVTVVYTLTNVNELRIEYTARSDRPTPVNLTHHTYWNLVGEGDVLGHELILDCDRYLPVDDTLIPTGELAPVDGTPMDFTQPHTIGSRIAEVPGGYDHCYAVAGYDGSLRRAAWVREPRSGRIMEVFTTEPGVQLYTGNFLDGTEDSGGYGKNHGFCLECQHFPDSPNQPDFPSTILLPGETYRQTTVYRFSVGKADGG